MWYKVTPFLSSEQKGRHLLHQCSTLSLSKENKPIEINSKLKNEYTNPICYRLSDSRGSHSLSEEEKRLLTHSYLLCALSLSNNWQFVVMVTHTCIISYLSLTVTKLFFCIERLYLSSKDQISHNTLHTADLPATGFRNRGCN
jgi:hypothetical protein